MRVSKCATGVFSSSVISVSVLFFNFCTLVFSVPLQNGTITPATTPALAFDELEGTTITFDKEEVTERVEIIATTLLQDNSSSLSARLSAPVAFDEEKEDPCMLFPCGIRAVCEVRHGNRSCSCLDGFYGNPDVKCREQCSLNSDCPEGMACVERNSSERREILKIQRATVEMRNECVDLCTIDPYEVCRGQRKLTGDSHNNSNTVQASPCSSNPCGENTWCEEKYGRAICHCQENFYGDPWSISCYPECSRKEHCPSNQVCMQMKCKNPCIDPICGVGAICQVSNHVVSCTCPENATEDSNPFKQCKLMFANDTSTAAAPITTLSVTPSETLYDY